jgi:hypothetical protein
LESARYEAAKCAAERPLPPVPEVFVVNSPNQEIIPSSLKRTKPKLLSSWFVSKKAVSFGEVENIEVEAEDLEEEDDDLSVFSPGFPSPK